MINEKSKSDFDIEEDFENAMKNDGSNAHSGGCVVLAESLEEAQKMIEKRITQGTFREISFKKGIIIYADGDC